MGEGWGCKKAAGTAFIVFKLFGGKDGGLGGVCVCVCVCRFPLKALIQSSFEVLIEKSKRAMKMWHMKGSLFCPT